MANFRNRIPMVDVPQGVLVTDNGGDKRGGTHDRFTVTLPTGDCYSMSTNVMDPEHGVCMFHGQNLKHDPDETQREQIPLHVAQKIKELL